MSASSWLVAAVAVAFVLYIAVQVRPGWRARRALAGEVRAARARAHAAKDPRERAAALCDAAGVAAGARRFTAAAGFLVRAMRTEPSSSRAVETATELLARTRPRLLEKMLWRRLAALPWDEAHRDATRAAARGLARVYGSRPLKDASRAAAMERLSQRI